MKPRYAARRVHRYSVEEIWGDAPEWLTTMVSDPEAYIVDTYRGEVSQWEVEKGGEIVYGWAGDYKGVSPRAMEKLALEPASEVPSVFEAGYE